MNVSEGVSVMSEEKTVFFITPIGDPDSDERARSDAIKESMIKPALDGLGYKCVRADEFAEPGRIDIQIIDKLLKAELVIADLSDQNANVFYELAVRHASQKPVILLCEEGQSLPFDIKTHRTIFYDINNGPKFVQAQTELRKQVEAVNADSFTPDSPIKEAILQRDPPDTDALAVINNIVRTNASILSELKQELSHIRNQVSQYSSQIDEVEYALSLIRGPISPTLKRVPRRMTTKNRLFEVIRNAEEPLSISEMAEKANLPGAATSFAVKEMMEEGILTRIGIRPSRYTIKDEDSDDTV